MAREESLEIGCGIGTDTINFARAGAQITTVDLSEKSMELERRRAFFGLEDRIRFCPGNAEQLSAFVPVEPYDLIYSFGVIHHTPHPEAVLAQLWQYTQPGTTIKIMVYHRRSWKVAGILLTEGRGILEAAGWSWWPKTPKLKPAAGDLYLHAAQQLAHGVLRGKMDS